jgi:hypothetical protein
VTNVITYQKNLIERRLLDPQKIKQLRETLRQAHFLVISLGACSKKLLTAIKLCLVIRLFWLLADTHTHKHTQWYFTFTRARCLFTKLSALLGLFISCQENEVL